MALIGISAPKSQARQDSLLDKILKGVQVAEGLARTGLSVYETIDQSKARQAQIENQKKAQDLAQQEADINFATKVQRVPAPFEEGMTGGVATKEGGFVTEEAAPIGAEIAGKEGRYIPIPSSQDGLTAELKRMRVEKLAREEAPPTDDELEQFVDNFPGNPLPKTRGELIRMTTQLGREKRQTNTQNWRREQTEYQNEERRNERAKARQEKLSKQMAQSGLESLQDKLDDIFEILAKYPDDIPGYGRGESMIPTALVKGDGKKLRQKIASLQNIELKKRSGAAVTAPEMERFLQEIGSGRFESEEALKNGLSQLKQAFDADRATIYAGFDDDTIRAYEERYADILGGTSFNPDQPYEVEGEAK